LRLKAGAEAFDNPGVGWRGRLLVAVAIIVAVEAALATPTLEARFDVAPITTAVARQRLQAATVELIGLGCDLSLRQGSAVALGPDRLVTSAHVVEAFRTLDIVPGASGPIQAARADVRIAVGADVATVHGAGLGARPLALAPYDPVPGEGVWLSGYLHDSGRLQVLPARVVDYLSGRKLGQPRPVMRLDVAARPGMSGGAVLDQAGRLAGIVFGVEGVTNDSLVVPASALRRALTDRLVVDRACALSR